MLTGRAWAVLATGVLMWLASRLLGAPDLHMAAVGLLCLVPLAALLVRFVRHDLTAVRRLSTRRAFPGTRVRVDIEVRNTGGRRTAMLLVEDRLPQSLGGPARGVLGEVRPGVLGRFTYEVTPRSRGRFGIGPLVLLVTDPFDLVHRRLEFDIHHDLIVYPAIEEIGRERPPAPVGGAGESSTRQLFLAAEEFYTMRAYEEGDDLRRIHWPSVARTGNLMIRQDEAERRAAASVFLDNRSAGVGGTRVAFERAVSAAASIGALYLRTGFHLRMATADEMPSVVELDRFLEILALARPSLNGQITPTLTRLAGASAGDGALVLVTSVPDASDIAMLSRLAPPVASKLAVLVTAHDPDELPIRPRHELDRNLEAARTSLTRAGWKVIALRPNERLGDAWPRSHARRPPTTVGSS